MSEINVEDFRLSDEEFEAISKEQLGGKAPRRKENLSQWRVPFIRSIPLTWKMSADRLPAKAGVVADHLWYRAGCLKRLEVVPLSFSYLSKHWGVSRKTAARGLTALEKAGLVKVQRHAGRAPQVTILLDTNSEIPTEEVNVNS